jgi:carboxypeptidase T
MKKAVALFLSLSIAVFCAPSTAFAVKSLIRVTGLSRAEILSLADQGNEVADVGKDFIELVVDSAHVKKLAAQHKIQTLIPDLNREIKKALTKSKEGREYFNFETMTAKLKEYAERYANICRLESIGKTFEGRDIWALKISDSPELNEKEPAVLIMGAHHAREWITFEVPMAAIQKLVEGYGTDDHLTRLVNDREIWFIPMVNPDGVVHSQTQSQYWRKNRVKNAGGTFGVDLNRNYGYKWGVSGSSSSPSSDTFKGPSAFSELETQAIRDFASKEKFSGSISFHSYSELILYPWSYASGVPSEHEAVLSKMAGEMAKMNKYRAQESCALYPAAGETDDWMHGDQKSLSFTFELGRTFIPPTSEIATINAANVPCIIYHIEKAGTYGLVTPVGEDQIPALDAVDCLNALRDFTALSNAAYFDVITRLQKALAQKVAAELKHGESACYRQIEAESNNAAMRGVLTLIKQCQTFDRLHSM